MSYNKEIGLWEGYIYLIINKTNDKKYVGQTITSIKKRFNKHKSDANMNKGNSLHDAIRKHGIENFDVLELEKISCKTKESLCRRLDKQEIYWIDYYDTFHGDGYNESAGGAFGSSLCEEKYIPVDLYDLKGNKIKEFENICLASDYTGADVSAISRCCKGKSKTAKGYTFRFHGDGFDKFTILDSRYKTVYKWNKDKTINDTYISPVDAANKTGLSYSKISTAIYYKRELDGFYWSYENEFPTREDIHDNKKKIDKYSLLGDFIKTYNSISDALLDMGKTADLASRISNCCNGKSTYALNYIWRYHLEPFNKFDTNIEPSANFKPFNVYTLDDIFIKTYLTYSDAGKELNYDKNTIGDALRSKNGVTKKYKFYYVWDKNQPDKSKIKTINQVLYEVEQAKLSNTNQA